MLVFKIHHIPPLKTGAVNVVMTIVSVALMDRLGRRSLMLIGLSGMTVSYAVVSSQL